VKGARREAGPVSVASAIEASPVAACQEGSAEESEPRGDFGTANRGLLGYDARVIAMDHPRRP